MAATMTPAETAFAAESTRLHQIILAQQDEINTLKERLVIKDQYLPTLISAAVRARPHLVPGAIDAFMRAAGGGA